MNDSTSSTPPAPPGYVWIYTRQFRHWRTGKIIRAQDHGRTAFRFLVKRRR